MGNALDWIGEGLRMGVRNRRKEEEEGREEEEEGREVVQVVCSRKYLISSSIYVNIKYKYLIHVFIE